MRRPQIALYLFTTIAGCSSGLPIENRPCPCAVGWVCCESGNVCVKEGITCPAGGYILTPASNHLWFGETLRLETTTPVVWRVVEGDRGGTIDSDGVYHAPLDMGAFHLEATPQTGSDSSTTIEVNVGPQTLTVFFGEPGGAGTADGFGRDARFSYPRCLSGDQETLYVMDWGVRDQLGAIRRIDIATGEVRTLADHLNRPTAFVSIGTRRFILEGYAAAGRISEFTAERKLSEVAGSLVHRGTVDGVGQGARFDAPIGMAAVDSHRLLVAEKHAMRLVDIETANVVTLPLTKRGCKTCTLPLYWETLVRAKNGLYLVSKFERGLWQLDVEKGEVEQVEMKFPADGVVGLASNLDEGPNSYPKLWGSQFGKVFFSTFGTSYEPIYVIDHNSSRGDLDGPSKFAFVNSPIDFLQNDRGGVYFIDYHNHNVKSVTDETGGWDWSVKTVAGQSSHDGWSPTRLTAPSSLALVNSNEELLLTGQEGQVSRIRNSRVELIATGYTGNFIAVSKMGHVVVSGQNNLIGLPPSPYWLAGNVMHRSGFRDGVGEEALFNDIRSMTFIDDHHLVVADAGNSAIRRVNVQTHQVETVSHNIPTPVAVSCSDPEVCYVANATSIWRLEVSTGNNTQVFSARDASQIVSLAWDPHGLLYFVDQGRREVWAYVPETGRSFAIAGNSLQGSGVKTGPLPGRFNQPVGLVYSPTDGLLISDTQENVILQAH